MMNKFLSLQIFICIFICVMACAYAAASAKHAAVGADKKIQANKHAAAGADKKIQANDGNYYDDTYSNDDHTYYSYDDDDDDDDDDYGDDLYDDDSQDFASARIQFYFRLYVACFGGTAVAMFIIDYFGIGSHWITTVSDLCDDVCKNETNKIIEIEKDPEVIKELKKRFSMQTQKQKSEMSAKTEDKSCLAPIWDRKERLGKWYKDDEMYGDYFKGCLLAGRRYYGIQSDAQIMKDRHGKVTQLISKLEFAEGDSRVVDLLFYFCNNQDMMAMGFSSDAHPYSRSEKQRSFFILQGLAFFFSAALTIFADDLDFLTFTFFQIFFGTILMGILTKGLYYVSALPCLQGEVREMKICTEKKRRVSEDLLKPTEGEVTNKDRKSLTNASYAEGDCVDYTENGRDAIPAVITHVYKNKTYDIEYGGTDLCEKLKKFFDSLAYFVAILLCTITLVMFLVLAYLSFYYQDRLSAKNLNAISILTSFIFNVFIVRYVQDFLFLFFDYLGVTLIFRLNLGCTQVTFFSTGKYYEEMAKYKYLYKLITDDVPIEKLYRIFPLYVFHIGILREMEDFVILAKIDLPERDEKGKRKGELEGFDKYVKKFLPCLAKKTEFEAVYDKLSVPEKSAYWSLKIDEEKKRIAGEEGGTDANPTSISPEVEMGNVSTGETTNPMAKKDDV